MSEEKEQSGSQGADQAGQQQDTSGVGGAGKARIPEELPAEARPAQKSLEDQGNKRG